MTGQPTIPLRLGGVYAEAPDLRDFHVGRFVDSQLLSRPDQPNAVELRVGPWLFDESLRPFGRDTRPDDISIFVVATEIRVIWPEVPEQDNRDRPYCQAPEFEVEGWLLDPPGNPEGKLWVRLVLHTTSSGELEECIVYLLQPGEERGTAPTPGMG
jgi:hypothetical protein